MKAKLTRRPAPTIRVQRERAPAVQARTQSQPQILHVIDGGLDSRNLMRLQSAAGNQAVGELLARPRLSVQAQAVACPPPPAAAAPVAAQQDPKFVAVKERIAGETVKQKAHPPAKAKVAEAQGAAQGPANEVPSKAAAAQVDEMSEQKPKGFDKMAFTSAVHVAIEKATPKNMEEVDEFKSSGKAGQIKDQVVGQVTQNKDAAAKDIKATSTAVPDLSKGDAKPVTPMQGETPGSPPRNVVAGDAMPAPKPADQVSLANTKCETDSQLGEANVTEEQVTKSNEPQFQDAMAAKKDADVHAATAPQQFREGEKQQLDASKSGAAAAATVGLSQMHQSRASTAGHVGSHKDEAKAKHEAALAKVSTEIEGIYNGTKKDVEDILNGLDKSVADAFDTGEKAARDAFENDYMSKKEAYFAKRYAGYEGSALWVADKLTSPPPEVNGFIDKAKQVYVSKMEVVINQVANLVETELNRATTRIQLGRTQINDYVAKQPKELQQIAKEAADNVTSKFDELDQTVTAKGDAVVDDLAQKYAAAAQEVDDRCNAMREENKGLLDQAKDKVAGMVETLKQMKAMLVQVAAKAESVVDQILQDPIGFLGNLVGAVKQGFQQFVGNILKHLAQGLMGWLLGELADAGITMPESFDLKGILSLVAQILGLTWANIRARAASMLGEEVVAMIEQGVEVFQKIVHIFTTLRDQGLAGLWEMIADKIGDLKAQVMDQIQDFVLTKVIVAGVTWVIGLLNPASAFVKACKAIYDIVMFFVERGSQIMALVNAIVDNLAAIASGNLSAAANLVEEVLGTAIPVVIGFMASLLGVGGISEKIKEVINAVRSPINKAVDWLLKTVVKPVANTAAKAIGWVKGKVKSGVDWLKKKGKAGVDYLKKKGAAAIEKVKSTFGKNDKRSAEEKEGALRGGMAEAEALLDQPDASPDTIKPQLGSIQQKYKMASLRLVVDEQGKDKETVHVEGSVNPSATSKKALVSLLPKRVLEKLKSMGLDDKAIAAVVAKSPEYNHVIGELFEQLGYLAGKQLAAEQKVQFFAGNRITDVHKAGYGDGILGIKKGKYLYVKKILEAKAGPMAATKLATETTALSRITNSDELERLMDAISDFKDEYPRWRRLKANEIYSKFPRQIDARAGRLPMEEWGQGRKDYERGAAMEGEESSTFLLDGEPIEFVVSPLMTQIYALLPSDVSGASEASELDAQGINYALAHLNVSTSELATLTTKIVTAAK